MQAFGYDHFGDPRVFKEFDIPTPQIGADQLLLTTQAVGLNNREAVQRRGGFNDSLPLIPGRDVVGTVAQVGAQVTGFNVGDLVASHVEHGYAAQVVAPAAASVLIPDGVDPTVAAAVITTGITAYNAVTYFGHITAGQRVIVRGASGGVGSLAVQIATTIGAQVIGIASLKNEDFVASLAADSVIAYDGDEEPSDILQDVGDVVIDTALNGAGSRQVATMAHEGGTVVTVAHDIDERPGIMIQHIHPVSAAQDGEALRHIMTLLGQRQLIVRVGAVLPFTVAGVQAGHQRLDQPQEGRTVLNVNAN